MLLYLNGNLFNCQESMVGGGHWLIFAIISFSCSFKFISKYNNVTKFTAVDAKSFTIIVYKLKHEILMQH